MQSSSLSSSQVLPQFRLAMAWHFFSGFCSSPMLRMLLWRAQLGCRPTTSAYFLERALEHDGADEFFKIPKTLSKNAVFLQTLRQSQHGQLHRLWALLAGQQRVHVRPAHIKISIVNVSSHDLLRSQKSEDDASREVNRLQVVNCFLFHTPDWALHLTAPTSPQEGWAGCWSLKRKWATPKVCTARRHGCAITSQDPRLKGTASPEEARQLRQRWVRRLAAWFSFLRPPHALADGVWYLQ